MSQPPPLISVIPTGGASPLTPEHLAQLSRAQELYRPISRARRYARFEAWTLMIFGMISFVTGLTSPSAIFVGLALCFTGFYELKASERLAKAAPAAPRQLAANQIVLALCLIVYSSIRLIQLHRHPTSLAAEEPSAAGLGDTHEIDDMVNLAMNLLYYSLIGIAIFVQGLTAVFYNSREKRVRAYLAEVPDWARSLAEQTNSH